MLSYIRLAPIYFIFIAIFTSLIINTGVTIHWLALLIFYCFSFKPFKFRFYSNTYINLIVISILILVTLENYSSLYSVSDNKDFNGFIKRIYNTYAYLFFLIFLPTAIKVSNFKIKDFFYIITYGLVLSLATNFYFILRPDYSRGLVADKLNPVISYDICVFSLTLIALILSKKYLFNKQLFIYYGLCFINFLLIFLHGTRGVIFAALILFIIYFTLYMRKNWIKISVLITLLSILTYSLFIYSLTMQERYYSMISDFTRMSHGDFASSIGSRFMLWEYSFHEFLNNIMIGVGARYYEDFSCKLFEQGIIISCLPNAHNIVIQELFAHGLLGALFLICSFVLPLIYFIRLHSKTNNSDAKLISLIGLCFIIFLLFSGASEFFLFYKLGFAFIFLVLATLLIFAKQNSDTLKSESL